LFATTTLENLGAYFAGKPLDNEICCRCLGQHVTAPASCPGLEVDRLKRVVYNFLMKRKQFLVRSAVLVFCMGTLTALADDYQLLKTKTNILVEQAQEFYAESRQKGSYVHGAAYQYYFTLMHTTGTNLLSRSESPANEKLLRAYFNLIKKDYEAYTKVNAAADKAAATGSLDGNAGTRHRAKRLVNAERLRDKELAAAIQRWEKFVCELKKGAKP